MFNFFKTRKKTDPKAISLFFNVNPLKYKHCKKYLDRLTNFFVIESKYHSNYHYIAINNDDGKLYEIHTRVIGFEGAYTHTKEVLDFVFKPRQITIKEFLQLVDSVYPEISILYSGINESNLMLYQKLMENWLLHHKKEDWKPLDLSNRFFTCVYQLPSDSWHKWGKSSRIYPLVVLSELLIENGFTFQNADVGGGIDEISHAGTKSYSAEYFQFEEFRDNCIEDIYRASDEIEKEYQGWASIDYRYISVTLKNGSIKVYAIDKNPLIITWTNPETAPLSFIKEINEKMICRLGGDITLQEYYKIKVL